ncbi:transducin/WD40 repeat-like superfamily protein [Artemisia annua]|uniref:Transducin/WD40 repeat-like superfamily protein n=1 Tax=Artemisia annua TaxID=35608 RepID=A0A2U1NID4_ARTAN|nr:transducin/WD40 repeat-like superfamily protein [Artemisia annua]
MSSLATSHMLIAAATKDVQVRLCDMATGAFAHTLSGHRGPRRTKPNIMAVESMWVTRPVVTRAYDV